MWESAILADLFPFQFSCLFPRLELAPSPSPWPGWPLLPPHQSAMGFFLLILYLRLSFVSSLSWNTTGIFQSKLPWKTPSSIPHYNPLFKNTKVHRAYILLCPKVAKLIPRFLDTQIGHCPFPWPNPLRRSHPNPRQSSQWKITVFWAEVPGHQHGQ